MTRSDEVTEHFDIDPEQFLDLCEVQERQAREFASSPMGVAIMGESVAAGVVKLCDEKLAKIASDREVVRERKASEKGEES